MGTFVLIRPTQTFYERIKIAQRDTRNAATAAGNLSELYVTLGDLAHALDYAQQAVNLADESSDAFLRMGGRAQQADSVHQAGRLGEAENLFREAEKMQKERQPHYPPSTPSRASVTATCC